MAWPSPPRRAGEQDGPPGEVHGGKTATVAVKPCRNGSPPTGPISPAAKKPAAGAPASSSSSASGVVVGRRRTSPRPRPLQVKTSAPAGVAAAQRLAPQAERGAQVAVGRRRRRGRAGARPCPPATGAPTVTRAGLGVGADARRARGSRPGAYSGLPPSMTIAEQQAAGDQRRCSALEAPRSRRAGGRAPGAPASSRITWPSAAVTVSSGPTGAAPCDTHGSTSTPSKATPTAPVAARRGRRGTATASPSGVRALAMPPRTGTPGARRASSPSTASVGNE